MNVQVILGPSTITIYRNGEYEVFDKTHPGYEFLLKAVTEGQDLTKISLSYEGWLNIKNAMNKLKETKNG